MAKNKSPRQSFTASLPPAACPQELRERFDDYAKGKKISYGELLREAVEFFLSNTSHKSGVDAQKVRS